VKATIHYDDDSSDDSDDDASNLDKRCQSGATGHASAVSVDPGVAEKVQLATKNMISSLRKSKKKKRGKKSMCVCVLCACVCVYVYNCVLVCL
jgi:hypothetical protein